MSYDLKIKSADEKNKVILNEAKEVGYWTKFFGCSEKKLRAAVNAIGNSVDEVRIFLEVK